jgi:hypothetical protein
MEKELAVLSPAEKKLENAKGLKEKIENMKNHKKAIIQSQSEYKYQDNGRYDWSKFDLKKLAGSLHSYQYSDGMGKMSIPLKRDLLPISTEHFLLCIL